MFFIKFLQKGENHLLLERWPCAKQPPVPLFFSRNFHQNFLLCFSFNNLFLLGKNFCFGRRKCFHQEYLQHICEWKFMLKCIMYHHGMIVIIVILTWDKIDKSCCFLCVHTTLRQMFTFLPWLDLLFYHLWHKYDGTIM